MTVRGLGAVMVVVAAVLIGRLLAEPYRQRMRGLGEWVAFLEQLKVELTFRQRPLAEACMRSATTVSLRSAAERLQQVLTSNGSLEEASQSAVGGDLRLGREEQTLLTALIPPLASAPPRWQGESLDRGVREVARILEQIREESVKKARMVETLSTLAGLTAVLMLL